MHPHVNDHKKILHYNEVIITAPLKYVTVMATPRREDLRSRVPTYESAFYRSPLALLGLLPYKCNERARHVRNRTVPYIPPARWHIWLTKSILLEQNGVISISIMFFSGLFSRLEIVNIFKHKQRFVIVSGNHFDKKCQPFGIFSVLCIIFPIRRTEARALAGKQ